MKTKAASAMLMSALLSMLLATAAATMLIESRAARASAGESLRYARAELAVERLLALALIQLDAGQPLAAQGLILSEENSGRVLRQDAAGLVDLNEASPERLAALLGALGVEAETASALADRIGDWRDEDGLRRPGGAEAEEYAAANLPAPGNRPFETEAELTRVMGLTPAVAACLYPFVTVFAGQGEIDPASAPSELSRLLSLPDARIDQSGAPLGRVIRLTAETPLSEHAVLRREIWVRLTGNPEAPFLIHRAGQEFGRSAQSPPACDSAAAP